jgi:hypothetical protein
VLIFVNEGEDMYAWLAIAASTAVVSIVAPVAGGPASLAGVSGGAAASLAVIDGAASV